MKKNLYSLILGLFVSVSFAKLGFAQEIDDIITNTEQSISFLPGLVAGITYLSGLIIAVTGILKIIDHVNNPNQTPIRVPVIRFLIAGALFSLPIIMQAAIETITGSGVGIVQFDESTDINGNMFTALSAGAGILSSWASFGTNINSLLGKMVNSIELFPTMVAGISYILGLLIIVSALYKTRDHVEDPNKVPLKDAVIRYITAGALFGLPTVFQAMYTTIAGSGLGWFGITLTITSVFSTFFNSTETLNPVECVAAIGGATLGNLICTSMINTIILPYFLSTISYFIGLVFGVWGILKIRDHVNEPSRVSLSEGVTRLIAGGAFFALPYVVVVLRESFLSGGLTVFTLLSTNTDFNSNVGTAASPCSTTNSLDMAMGCFMQDIMGPAHIVLNFFAYVAGTIFIMIGISRLIKSSQEGPKGPGGLGTFGTFVVGGLLLSATTILRAFSASMFSSTTTYTFATMQYTTGMSATETQAAHNVISAVLRFLIVIGMISFVRGMFIMRDVAEGKGQASTMAGLTHMIGGALAVNMGPLLNAIQQTLGITAFGVTFT